MPLLESQIGLQKSGIFAKKRIITFDHVFNTGIPNLDLLETISLDKNSYFQIDKLIVCFQYAKAANPGSEYYTNFLNYSGKFTFEIEETDSGTILSSFKIPIKNSFELKFDNLIFDEGSIKSLTFNSENSSLESYKEGVTNISSTIEKIGLYFYMECFDYSKELFRISGKNIVYRINRLK